MIDEENNLEQCDQFTKPEEIDALRKYLRARIDEVNSRTELGSGAVKLSPSYGNEFDPDRENLPDAVLGVPQNSDQSRIDKVQNLEDPGIRPPIPTSATNVSINDLTDTNAERLIGEIPNVSLGEERDPIPFRDFSPGEIELGNHKETIKVNQETSLDEEKINIPGEKISIKDLSDTKEITHGEFKEQSNLSNVLESLTEDQGSPKSISLGEDNEKIGKNFGGEVDSLSDFSSTLPGDINNPDELPTDREKLIGNEHEVTGLSDFLSPLLPDEGKQFDASKENLPDAVLGVPQNSDQSRIDKVRGLSDERIDTTGDFKEVGLSNILEKTSGIYKTPELSDERIDATGDFKDVDLSNTLEKVSGTHKTPKLGDTLENIPRNLGGNKIKLEDEVLHIPKNKNQEENLDHLRDSLPEGGTIERSHNPNSDSISLLRELLSDNILSVNQNPDYEDSYLNKELPKDGKIPEDPRYERVNSLREVLSGTGLIPPDRNTDFKRIEELSETLPNGGTIPNNEFESVEELRESLPEGGIIPNSDSENIDNLREELPNGGIIPNNELESVEDLVENLPDGGKIPNNEFEEIEDLRESLPDGGIIPNSNSENIDNLREELPDGGIIPSNESESIEDLRESLPDGGKIPNNEFEEIEDLRESLPDGGIIPNNESGDIEDLVENLPDGGEIPNNELESVEDLNETLPDGGKIPNNESENVEDLVENLPDGGKIPNNELESVEDLSETLPDGGIIPSNESENIEDLREELPDGGIIPNSETEDINDLSNSLPDGGKTPSNSRPDGDSEFENIEDLRETLPDGGTIPSSESEDIEDLPDTLPEGGKTPSSETEDINDLSNSLPDGGKTPSNSRPDGDNEFESVDDLRDVLPNGGTTPANSRPENDSTSYEDIDDLKNELPEGGITPSNTRPDGDNEFENIEDLKDSLSSGGEIPLNVRPDNDNIDYRDILDLDEFLSNGGIAPDNDRPYGDIPYQYPMLREELPNDGNGDLPDNIRPDNDLNSFEDIEDLEGFLTSSGSFIPLNSRPNNDRTDYEEIEDLPNIIEKEGTIFHRKDGRLGGLGQQLLENKVESAFERRGVGKKLQKTPTNSRPENDDTGFENIEDNNGLKEKLPIGGTIPTNSRPRNDSIPFEDIEDTVGLRDELPDGGTTPDNTRPRNDSDFENIEELRNSLSVGGTIPVNSRPGSDLLENSINVEDFSSLNDLVEALRKRGSHDIDGYLKYLVNFAESKDLSSGWGQKLSELLGELNTLKGGFNIDTYKNWEGRLYGAVIEYNGDTKNSVKIGYSKLPNSLEAYANYNSYLRFAVDQARRGYNELLDESGFLRKADGVLGLKEEMLDMLLIALVQQRDKLERVAKANRDRLPGDGGNGALQDLVRGDAIGAALNFGKDLYENLKSNAASTFAGFLDTSDPHNRPKKDDEVYGWYSADYDSPSDKKQKFSERLKSAASAAFLGSTKSPNVFFQDRYLGGQGIRTTLYDLAEKDLDSDILHDGRHPFGLGVKEFFKVIRQSPLITNPSKFTGMYDPDKKGEKGGTTYSLDVNNFWEIVIEPYIGKDNGFCSYLPSVEEINVLNKYQHGVRTFYNRWIPITQFDLSRSRTTSKSVGLFGGEFTIPGGIEFTNELRMTVVDDSYKSWRRYFEKCSDVSVYSSRIHKKEFYGWLSNGIQKDAKTAMGSDYADWKMVTPVDKTHFALAPYKNITFRIRIYIMTPQFSTINKYDLLGVMKEFSVERQGEIDPGSQDLEISFSIVGETNDDNLFTPVAQNLNTPEVTAMLEEDKKEREEYIKSGKYKEDVEDYQKSKKVAEDWFNNRHNNLYGGGSRASILGGI